jgi:hypothetical protein
MQREEQFLSLSMYTYFDLVKQGERAMFLHGLFPCV